MKVSKAWLQDYIVEKLPTTEEIVKAFTMHAFEVEGVEKTNDDEVIDVKVLPDRAHYALSHYGVAGELAVILGLKLKPRNEIKLPEFSKELEVIINEENKNEPEKLCKRYTGAIIKGIKVGPSPEWLKNRLEAIGQRSINNIVDATNYVMLSVGQPTHVFDIAKLEKKDSKIKIEIKKLDKDEKIIALDNKSYELKTGTLVITDANSTKILAIAGVKGGAEASVTDSTTDILLESANFDPVTVRKTGRNLGLVTDAQKRFENELTPELAIQGLSDLIKLITEIAGDESVQIQVEGYVDSYPEIVKEWNVKVSLKEINDLLGTSLNAKEVEAIIMRFGWTHACITVDALRYWSVTPPHERLDIVIKEDLIEEIGRIYGYDHIEAKVPELRDVIELNKTYAWCETLRSLFVESGYSEVYTYAFRNSGDVELAYPLAVDKAFVRSNLKDGVAEALELNKKNKDLLGLKEIKIFEIGNVFAKDREQMNVCFANEKEIKEMSLEEAVEHMKIVNVTELPEIKISENKYKPISLYPYIVRDIAVWIPDSAKASPGKPEDIEVTNMITDDSGELLVKGPTKFDQFSKDGKTSYAYRMVYQSMDRTLTIEEVNVIITKITEKMNAKEGWKVR
jgi:phenylalanyl-tRNA synthetase beta chain